MSCLAEEKTEKQTHSSHDSMIIIVLGTAYMVLSLPTTMMLVTNKRGIYDILDRDWGMGVYMCVYSIWMGVTRGSKVLRSSAGTCGRAARIRRSLQGRSMI